MYYRHIRRCCVYSGFGRTLHFTSSYEEGGAVCLVGLVGHFALRAASAKSSVEVQTSIFPEGLHKGSNRVNAFFNSEKSQILYLFAVLAFFFFFYKFPIPLTLHLQIITYFETQYFSIIHKPVKQFIPVLGE